MPSGFTQLNAPRRLASKYARADEKRQNALAESQGPNMDPYNTEAAVTGPGSSIQGFTPGNPQSIIDYLGNIGGITRMATMNRGGIGPIELPNWSGMARGIAKRPQEVPDVLQAGNLAALERIASKGATGPEATKTARSAMRHYTPEGTRAEGVDVNATSVIRKARAKLGDVGSDKILKEVQRLNPKLTKDWTYNTIHEVDAGKRARPLSLDAPVGGNVESTIGEGLAGMDRTDALASIREQIAKLSPAMQKHVQDLMSGEKLPQDLNPKTLASLRSQMKGGAAISGKTPKPISGGTVGPEDLSAEFPSHQFRDVLQRQPGQMFGSQGPAVTREAGLANDLQTYLRELALSGGGERRAPGAIPESQHYTLGAGRLAEDWARIRAILGHVGQFQGRN